MLRLLAFFAAVTLTLPALWADDVAPSVESGFISNARQLIYEGKRSGEGYFHPDGNLLVFQSEREEKNPFYQIYLLDLLSGESVRLSSGVGKTTCAFFQPGSSRLLYSSTQLDPETPSKQAAELEFRASGKQRRYAWDYDAAMDIFSSQQDGTQLKRLTETPGYDAEAAFSPDGKKIVFCSLRAAYPLEALSPEDQARFEKDPAFFGDIYIMNADGSEPRRLTTSPGYDGGPFFSPDGERIVWRRFDSSGMNADIFTMKTDGSDVQRLTDFKSMSWAPYPHPSGKYIIF
ncbi:MAG: peptidase M28, partial [Verrucomicrobiota bacterium]